MKHITLFALACLLLAACAAPAPEATPTPIPDTPTPEPTATSAPPPGVTLYFVDTAQFEITTQTGRRVLVDVANPNLLTSPPNEEDVLLVTHTHNDHYNQAFIDGFPGQKLIVEEGQIELPDVSIRGIASAHNVADPFLPKDGSNYIFIIDVAGLRLAHFGDIGQETFTPEQLEALGQVDVAMTQFVNSFSAMDIYNLKGFNLMEQLQPRMVIPTHSSLKASQEAVNRWAGHVCEQPCFVHQGNLPGQASVLFLGNLADSYQTIYDLPWFGQP